MNESQQLQALLMVYEKLPTTIDHGTLTRLIIAVAKSDKTEPPCWRLNEVLGGVERLVLNEQDNPALYAQICGAALYNLLEQGDNTEELAVRTLLSLGVINGRRRVDGQNPDEIQRWFSVTRRAIDSLPDGPRKDRCQSFWSYQAGVFMARNGFYADAAKNQEQEADNIKNTPAARAVAAYLAIVYSTWDAMVSGLVNKVVENIHFLKTQALPKLQEGVKGSSMELQWGGCNGPFHALQAMILADKPDREEGAWQTLAKQLQDGSKTLGGDFVAMSQVVELASIYYSAGASEELREKILDFLKNANSTLGAHASLILARVYRDLGKKELAREVYGNIKPAPDMHMVAAVATYELGAMN